MLLTIKVGWLGSTFPKGTIVNNNENTQNTWNICSSGDWTIWTTQRQDQKKRSARVGWYWSLILIPVEFTLGIKPNNLEKGNILITGNLDEVGPEIQVCIIWQSLSSHLYFPSFQRIPLVLWPLHLFTQDFWDTTFLIYMMFRSSLGKNYTSLLYLSLRQM